MEELMEMRHQLAAMKESLDKSQIVNNKLLKKVMSGKASFLNRIVIWEIIGLPFIVLILLANCVFYNATTCVAWVVLIFGAIDIAFDFKTLRIPVKDVNEMSLIELRKKIIRQKHLRNIQTIIGISLCVPWALWAYVEWFKPMNYIEEIINGDPTVWTIIILLALLLAVAILFTLWLLKKINKTSDSIVAEINESRK